MKLLARVNGDEAQDLTLEREGDVCRYTFNGAQHTATIREVEPGVYSVLTGGRSYLVRVNGAQVEACGSTLIVDVQDPRRAGRKSRSGFGEGRQNISAPMPGKVIRVLVSAGEAVEAGQGLAVVEAMKMQNEMKAPKAGTVIEVRVREGSTVAAGEILLALE